MNVNVEAVRREVEQHAPQINQLRESVGKVIVGQRYMVERLLVGLLRLSQGAIAFQGWLDALAHPLAILFHLVVLAACLFHAKTWFALAPKAMRVMYGEEPIPDRPIVLAQYIALGVVSLVVLIVALVA